MQCHECANACSLLHFHVVIKLTPSQSQSTDDYTARRWVMVDLPRRSPPPVPEHIRLLAASMATVIPDPSRATAPGAAALHAVAAAAEGGSVVAADSEVAAPHVFLREDDGPVFNGYAWPK